MCSYDVMLLWGKLVVMVCSFLVVLRLMEWLRALAACRPSFSLWQCCRPSVRRSRGDAIEPVARRRSQSPPPALAPRPTSGTAARAAAPAHRLTDQRRHLGFNTRGTFTYWVRVTIGSCTADSTTATVIVQ